MSQETDLFDLDSDSRLAVADQWGRELAHAEIEKTAAKENVLKRTAGNVMHRIRSSSTTKRMAAGAVAGGAGGAASGKDGDNRAARGAVGAVGGAAAAFGGGKAVDFALKKSKNLRAMADRAKGRMRDAAIDSKFQGKFMGKARAAGSKVLARIRGK